MLCHDKRHSHILLLILTLYLMTTPSLLILYPNDDADFNQWISDLDDIDINQIHNKRQCEVVLVVENSAADSPKLETIEKLGEVDDGRPVRCISRKSLYELVEDFGKSCDNLIPKLDRIIRCACFEAEQYVRQGNKIPLDLLAKLLKIRIICLVTQDVLYEQGSTETDWCVELSGPALKSKTGEKGGKDKKGKGKGKEKQKGKGKEKQKGKAKKSAKTVTKADPCDQFVQVRTKEGRKNVQVGEKTMYIALTGFYQSQIITLCYDNGIFIRSVIKFYESPQELTVSSNSNVLQPKSDDHINNGRNVDLHNKTCVLRKFWDDIYRIYFENPCSFLEQSFLMTYSALPTLFNDTDISRLTKVLPAQIIEQNFNQVAEDSPGFANEDALTFPSEENAAQPVVNEKNCDKSKEDCDQFVEQEMVYRHFHNAVLKIEDVLWKHEVYLNNLNVHKLDYTPSSRSLDVYNHFFNKLPINWNVGVITHYMLDELAFLFGDEFSTPSLDLRENVQINPSNAQINPSNAQINTSIAHADVRDQIKRVLRFCSRPGDVEETQPDQNTNVHPRIFHECDRIREYLSYFEQLPRVLLEESTSWLTRNEHVTCWEEHPKISPEEESTYRRQRKEWSRCFGISDRSMCSCLYAIVFSVMSQSCGGACHCDEEFSVYPAKINLERHSFHRPSHCCCDLKPAVNLKRCKLSDVTHVEDVSREVFLQEFAQELGNFEHVAKKYVPFFDTVVFMLHHGDYDQTGVTKTSWKSKVRTVVKLADFAHFAMYEDRDFIEELETRAQLLEELEEEIRSKEYNRNLFEVNPEMFVITDSIKDNLRKKYESLASQEVGKKSNGKRSRDSGKNKKGGKGEKANKITKEKDKSKTKAKKGKTKTATEKPINVLEVIKGSKLDVEVDVNLLMEDPFFHVIPLNAYDFGENLLRAEGSTVTFNSVDQLRVRVEFNEIHQTFQQLSVCVCLNDHNLVAYPRSRGEPGFHFRLRNGTLLAFGESPRLHREENDKFYLLREGFRKDFPCLDYSEAAEEDAIMKSSYLRKLFDKPSLGNSSCVSFDTLRNELEELKCNTSIFAARFRICSSKLHKYKYVVKVRNPLEIHLNKIVKFLKRYRRENKKLSVKRSIPKTSKCRNKSYYFKCTSPNGLHVETTPRGTQNSFCIVQRYLLENQNTASEQYRLFLRNGRLAIKRNDGKFILYTAYGEVVEYKVRLKPNPKRKNPSRESKRLGNFTQWVRKRVEKLCRKQIGVYSSKFKKSRSIQTQKITQLIKPKNNDIQFNIYTADGKTVKYRNSKISVDSSRFFERRDDYVKRVQVFDKEDGTVIYMFENGYCQSQYVDGTRVTSWYEIDCEDVVIDVSAELGEEESVSLGSFTSIHIYYQFEHPSYATVTYGGPQNIFKLTLPQDTVLKYGDNGDLELDIDGGTKASVGGGKVVFYSARCGECRENSTCTLFTSSLCNPNNFDAATPLLEARDSYGKVFSLDHNGRYAINNVQGLNTCSNRLHKKQPSHRFFVANRNLSGKFIWTKDMYDNRLADVVSSRRDENVVIYVNDKTGEVETVEFKTYENNEYLDTFLLGYLDIPNQKHEDNAAGATNHVAMKHRILDKIKSMDLQNVLKTIGEVVKRIGIDNTAEELLNRFTEDVVEANEELRLVESDDSTETVKMNAGQVLERVEEWKLKCEELRDKIHARGFINYFKFLELGDKSTSDVSEVDEEQVYFAVGESEKSSFSSGEVRSTEETPAGELSMNFKASSEKVCENVISDILHGLSSQHVMQLPENSSGGSLEISCDDETTSKSTSEVLNLCGDAEDTTREDRREDVEMIFHASDVNLESQKSVDEDIISRGEEPKDENSEIICSCELNSLHSLELPVEDNQGNMQGSPLIYSKKGVAVMDRIRELFDPAQYIHAQYVLAESQNNIGSEHGFTRERVSFLCQEESSNVKIINSFDTKPNFSYSKCDNSFGTSHEENPQSASPEPEQYPFIQQQKHVLNEEMYVDAAPFHNAGKRQFKSSFQARNFYNSKHDPVQRKRDFLPRYLNHNGYEDKNDCKYTNSTASISTVQLSSMATIQHFTHGFLPTESLRGFTSMFDLNDESTTSNTQISVEDVGTVTAENPDAGTQVDMDCSCTSLDYDD